MIRIDGSSGEGGGQILRHPRVYGPDFFLARTFLPLLERMGPTVRLQFERYGFCPAGGGRCCAEIEQTRNSAGPGNVVTVESGTAAVAEIFSAFGQFGVSAGKVASTAACDAREYLVSQAAAGEHLTDQLPLPLGLAGAGPFMAEKIDLHARTNMTVVSGQSAYCGSRWARGCGAAAA
jgi:RNA 3'-terminal phosphate cyclase (ATP)